MHVTLVGLAHPYRGGIAHYTSLLFRGLERHHRVTLISFTRQYPMLLFPGKTQLDESRVSIDVPNARIIDSLNPVSWLRAFARIRRQAPTLLIVQWWQPFLGPCLGTIALLVRLLSKTRIVFICHNLEPHERRWTDRLLSRYALAWAHGLVIHADQQRPLARKLAPRAEVTTHPHPAYDQFRRRGVSRDEARAQLGVSGNTLLFFGYVRRYKGLAGLLRAMPYVLRQTQVTLIIAGEFYEAKGPYLDLIAALNLGNHIHVVDRYIPNEEVEVFFSACDAVVCPYTSASQSGIVQIAFAFAKPVICTRVGGLPEAVLDGKTGVLADSDDPRDLAHAVLAYYESRNTVDFAGHIARDRGRFSWETLVEAITHV